MLKTATYCSSEAGALYPGPALCMHTTSVPMTCSMSCEHIARPALIRMPDSNHISLKVHLAKLINICSMLILTPSQQREQVNRSRKVVVLN